MISATYSSQRVEGVLKEGEWGEVVGVLWGIWTYLQSHYSPSSDDLDDGEAISSGKEK